RDARHDAVASPAVAALEDAADDALLPPNLPLRQHAIGRQARQPGAGAGAARRAVIRLPRTQHEVPAVVGRVERWATQLDVIDVTGLGPRDAVAFQGLTDSPGEAG